MQQSCLLNNLFYHHLLESGVDTDHIIRFAFDSAEDLYMIGESLIQIEKEKRGVDPEKFIKLIQQNPIVYRFDGPLKFKFVKALPENKERLEFVMDLVKTLTE